MQAVSRDMEGIANRFYPYLPARSDVALSGSVRFGSAR
ncbi:Uncharacterised protein [Chlamydia abortus]|nr:Uncharacterised protein [Chlamydia abortus]